MQTAEPVLTPAVRRAGRRFGYGIAVVVNLVMILVVYNAPDWEWFRFLTQDYERVVPWLALALWLSAGANLLYMVFDDWFVKRVGQIGVNIVNLVATVMLLRTFPFDFADYSFDWTVVTRVVLILAIVGTGLGMVTELVRLAKGEPELGKEASDADGI